jgi:Tfp pilus assembly PilM family ATPase
VFLKVFSRPAAGVDINASDVRILLLRRQRGHFHVENFAVSELPPGAFADGKIRDAALVRDVLQKLVKQTRAHNCRAAFALPAQHVRFQQLAATAMLADKAAHFQNCAGFQGELCFDYHASTPQTFLLAAARLEQVNQLAALAAQVKLDVQLITVDSYALARAFSLLTDNGVLLDVAPEVSQFLHWQNQTIVYKRYWPTTALDFAAQFAEALAESSSAEALYISGELPAKLALTPMPECHSAFADMTLSAQLDARQFALAAPRLFLCCGLALGSLV